MGWTGLTRPLTATQYLLDAAPKLEILASNTTGRATYVAFRRDDGDVGALVVLREKHGRHFMFKLIEEAQFPYYFGASNRVLSVLSETTNEDALKWRAACRAEQAKKAEAKANPFKPGDKFRYGAHDYAVDEVLGRAGYIIKRIGDGRVFRLPNTRVKDCVRIAVDAMTVDLSKVNVAGVDTFTLTA